MLKRISSLSGFNSVELETCHWYIDLYPYKVILFVALTDGYIIFYIDGLKFEKFTSSC